MRLGLAILISLVMVSLFTAVALAAGEIAIEADSLVFSGDGQSVEAAGNVVLTYEDLVLQADNLTYRGQEVEAAGNVRIATRDLALRAAWIRYDLETGALTGRGVQGRLGGYSIRADEITPGAAGEENLYGAGLTRCDLATPCYELQAGRISIAGNMVTIERGWLSLRGHRLLPLPRLTLNLDRIDEWPRLSAGYDDRGLYLGAAFTIPVRERLGLIIAGELATDEFLTLRSTLAWRPTQQTVLKPWIEYDSEQGWLTGFAAATTLGSMGLHADLQYEQATSRLDYKLTAAGPARPLFNGRFHLEGFWSQEAGGIEPETEEAGMSLIWTGESSPRHRSIYGLSLGRTWTDGVGAPLLRIRAEILRSHTSNWGYDLQMEYDLRNRSWKEGEFGALRYFHCYYMRIGYDWVEDVAGLSLGILF